MAGYIYAALTGLLFGLQGAYGKVLAKRIPPMLLAWGMFAFSLPVLTLLLLCDGIPVVDWPHFIWATGFSVLANWLAWGLFFRALQVSALAHTMPFTAFTPVFLIPVAYVLLDELPSITGLAGILLIIAGAYGIHMSSGRLLDPFRLLFRNRGTRWILIAALIWSVSATVDKVGVLASSQLFYAFILNLCLSLVYLPYLVRYQSRSTLAAWDNWKRLFLFGLVMGLLMFVQFTALKYLLVSYVIAFKRTGVIVSVVFGAAILGERNVRWNLVCTALMIAGVFLLVQ
jgi:drug/metabolite transporter (DMT)-like permease